MTVHDMHLEISKDIDASPDAVYALVADLGRMGDWSTENIGGEWTSGEPGKVGSRFLGTNRIKSFEWSVPVEVTIADPGQCFEFVAAPDDGPFVRWTYQIEPSEAGRADTAITRETPRQVPKDQTHRLRTARSTPTRNGSRLTPPLIYTLGL